MIHLQQFLSVEQQLEVLQACREVGKRSPLFVPRMKNGSNFSCQMTNCGEVGWISDEQGYRYSTIHPTTGKPFTPMPEIIKNLAKSLAAQHANDAGFIPQTCLINYYENGSKLGLHQDNSEPNKTAPIISISLGDDAIFLVGGNKRSDKTREILLKSGDVIILAGESRMIYHGIKKIIPSTSSLLKAGGRLNLTIRQVY
ncbi:alpha-ketoglutarate-dependent dioxygenase AlkB [Cylindrospermum sp. FACHB-282]|uniref:alpha-ketoglutarate-dependent dioxygenase AlkB n=1 Tax=Cylindrospermum sp. FACHB-282 TaxID=2692794 RepID=UPI0016846ADB|nr:alpha-ketoglutarate-dependent dioxygenase AlkB [Cylindrospermum sp. FACHB-282]MBD2386008.1 alpha-ketoglutarate-dependent dioxygenase AlkB [Cylindrospermum sp. FACHB-282]